MVFDTTISLGQIISAIGVILTLGVIWMRIERLLARLDERTQYHGKRLDILENVVLDPDPPSGYTVHERYP